METLLKVAFALWIGAGVIITISAIGAGIIECAVEAWGNNK